MAALFEVVQAKPVAQNVFVAPLVRLNEQVTELTALAMAAVERSTAASRSIAWSRAIKRKVLQGFEGDRAPRLGVPTRRESVIASDTTHQRAIQMSLGTD